MQDAGKTPTNIHLSTVTLRFTSAAYFSRLQHGATSIKYWLDTVKSDKPVDVFDRRSKSTIGYTPFQNSIV
jgi:hypothetical protein